MDFNDFDWLEPVTAVIIVLIAVAVAVIVHKFVIPVILWFTHQTPTDLDSQLVRSIRWPLNLAIITVGTCIAVVYSYDLEGSDRIKAIEIASAVGLVIGILLVVALLSSFMDWYLANLAARTSHVVDLRLFPLLRRVGVVVIYGIGTIWVLNVLGIPVTPLVAGLGIGGLAIALALQPTLANLFAGTYVMTEGAISTGDYIELEGGVAGYVVEVGWRSTRIRTWGNNLVVVPNARFAETIITNYQEPMPAVNVYLTCGVSYDSDLDEVERVSREVMDELIRTDPNAVREYGSWFAFNAFGESNVDFWLFMQSRDRIASFSLQSELIKALHRAFKEEDIVINYPMRTLQFPDGFSMNGIDGQGQVTVEERRTTAGRTRTRAPRDFQLDESEEGPDVGGITPGGGGGPLGGPDGPD